MARAQAMANACETLQDLESAIAAFDGCPLSAMGARQAVFARGRPDAEVVIIGEGPGAEEDLQGAPFVGRAGRLLDRMLAAGLGFFGVLIVVYPNLNGQGGIYNLAMLASSPLFAASFLITKALTRRDRPEVIVVWQSITVSLFSLPFALMDWIWPSPLEWLAFVVCGVLGSTGHYCMTRALRTTDISATQSVKFLDLVWNATAGFLVFSDVPTHTTLLGGFVIFLATTWIARREARNRG